MGSVRAITCGTNAISWDQLNTEFEKETAAGGTDSES